MSQWLYSTDAYAEVVFDGVIISPFAQIILGSITCWEVLIEKSV
jgi:hypothetical protein